MCVDAQVLSGSLFFLFRFFLSILHEQLKGLKLSMLDTLKSKSGCGANPFFHQQKSAKIDSDIVCNWPQRL